MLRSLLVAKHNDAFWTYDVIDFKKLERRGANTGARSQSVPPWIHMLREKIFDPKNFCR